MARTKPRLHARYEVSDDFIRLAIEITYRRSLKELRIVSASETMRLAIAESNDVPDDAFEFTVLGYSRQIYVGRRSIYFARNAVDMEMLRNVTKRVQAIAGDGATQFDAMVCCMMIALDPPEPNV